MIFKELIASKKNNTIPDVNKVPEATALRICLEEKSIMFKQHIPRDTEQEMCEGCAMMCVSCSRSG